MTYVDRSFETTNAIPLRTYFPRSRMWITRVEESAARSFLTFNSFLGYLADERGPTSSASVLACRGLAAAGAVLYEAWYADGDFDRPQLGLLGQPGCLRRLAGDLHHNAMEEVQVHREIFARPFRLRRSRIATSTRPHRIPFGR